MYGPKLLKENKEMYQNQMFSYQLKAQPDQIQKIVRDIVKALIEFTKQGKFVTE
jgi:hypothetical protein